MSALDSIKKQRALYYKEDLMYQKLIQTHQQFSQLILDQESTPESLESVTNTLTSQLQTMQAIIQQASLVRQVKSGNIEHLVQTTTEIQSETEKRTQSLEVFNAELKQAVRDAKSIKILKPHIEHTLQYPTSTKIEQDSSETRHKLSILESSAHNNDQTLEKWKHQSAELVTFVDSTVCYLPFTLQSALSVLSFKSRYVRILSISNHSYTFNLNCTCCPIIYTYPL